MLFLEIQIASQFVYSKNRAKITTLQFWQENFLGKSIVQHQSYMFAERLYDWCCMQFTTR